MSFTDLPSVHDIIDEDALKSSILKQSTGEKIVKDRRLINWKKWLNERQKVNERLSSKLNRHNCELLTNYGESLSTIKKDKLILEYARIPYPHDKYRGNPSFFQTPVALSRKHQNDPDYFAIKTKPEENLIPEVEYVAVPKCIQEEKKTICPGYRNVKDLWMDLAYRKERVQQLQEQLKIVEPYKPELDDLCMIGKSIKRAKDVIKIGRKPKDDFTITYMEKSKGISATPKYIVQAAKRNIHENEEYITLNNVRLCHHAKKNREIYLDFDYDVDCGKALTKTVYIKNGTSIALRYNFTQATKFNLFQDIVEYDTEQVFFFDKRTNIMLPNETVEFQVHFKTFVPSYYNFTLQLHLIPNIFRLKFLIHLNGISTKQNLQERIEILKRYITDKVNNNIARDIVEELLKNLETPQSHITLYTYDRAYIFETVNQKFTATTRRPKYIYNKEVVDELEEFYVQIRFKGCPPYWNYNIEELKRITKKREKLNRQKDLLDQIYLMRLEDLKQRKLKGENIDEEIGCVKEIKPLCEEIDKEENKNTDEDNKESKEGENVDENKSNEDKNVEESFSDRLDTIIKDFKDLIESKQEKECLTTQLDNILMKLDKTCYSVNNLYDTHGYVYGILCITFDKIMVEVEKVKETLQIKTLDHYPHNPHRFQLNLLQNQVFLDEEQPKYPKVVQDFVQEGLPPSELLKGIPFDDVQAKHLAYYGPPKVEDDGKKGKKGKDKGKKDKKDKGKKDKKGKEKPQKLERPPTPQIDLKPVQDFEDPFKQGSTLTESSTSKDDFMQSESVTLDSLTTADNRIEEYKLNLYKIFYKNLSDAIVRITDIIETNKPRKLKMDQFQTIWKHKLNKGSVKVKYIDIKKTLCKVIGAKTKSIQKLEKKGKKKEQERVMDLPETLQPKQSGSLWSILRPLKQPVPSQKPISYPELSLLIRKRTLTQKTVDVSTIMSACSGFDTNWQPFQEAEVQVGSKTDITPAWESQGIAAGIVEDIVDDVCSKDEFSEEDDDDDSFKYLGGFSCEEEGEEEESDVFFDDDFSCEENLEMNNLYSTNI